MAAMEDEAAREGRRKERANACLGMPCKSKKNRRQQEHKSHPRETNKVRSTKSEEKARAMGSL